MVLEDVHDRPLLDLRISVTDRCNMRCRYCMPREHFDENHEFLPKEDILRLRSEGKSFNQISKELGCSKSLISYHCGDGSEKKRASENNKKRPILHRKISSFKCKPPRKVLSTKLKGFKRHSKGARYRNKSSVNSISENSFNE